MHYDALIIIDMQIALVEAHPYNETAVIENIKSLLHTCREAKIPVIYIQHNGGTGDELEHGGKGWHICESIAPLSGEKIFEKEFNSAFRKTGLRDYLYEIGAHSIILCGMQTEYCIDVSCKVAFEFGFSVTVPHASTTTFDNSLANGKSLTEYYEREMWNNRYARVIPVEQTIAEIGV